MKPQQLKIFKFGTNYGILTGVLNVLFTTMLIPLNMLFDQSISKALAGLLLLVLPIVLAIANFKKQNAHSLSISQALGVGMVTAVIAACISIIFTYLLTNFIVSDYWDLSAAHNTSLLRQQYPEITATELSEKLASQRSLAWITYPIILLFNIALGFITSFIAGIVLKTKETFS